MPMEDSPATEGELGNEQAVRTAQNKARLLRVERAGDWDAVIRDPHGRRVILRILEICHLHAPSFVQGLSDLSDFREGERNVGLQICAELEALCPESWKAIMLQSMQEAIDARVLRDEKQQQHEEREE